MSSSENNPTDPIWHVEVDGRRVGPLTDDQVRHLIARGKLNGQSPVWTPGLHGWVALSTTEFGSEFTQTPPPLAGNRVPQGLIWLLAFAPLIGSFLEGLVSGMTRTPMTSLWWITLMLNCGLSIADERRLAAAGYQTKGIGAALVVPLYMWQRATVLDQRPWYLAAWIGCLMITMFA